LGLPGHLWAAPFMALASAYLAPGVFRLLGLQATDARALRQTGIGVSALALAWTFYWMVSVWADRDPGTPGVAERVLAGAAPLAASLWAAVLAYQQRAISWGYAAMALAGVGVAIVVEGLPRYPGSIAFATALGAIAYHSIAWLVRIPRHSAQAATSGAPAEGNAALAFERPATVAGWLLTGASVLLASLELAGAPGPTEAWFTTLTYLGVTAILAASAYVHRAPRFAHGALALLPLPYSLAVASISGTALAGLPLPGSLLAFSWTGLGLFYVAGGFAGERLIPRYVGSAPWVAYAVLGLAALAGLGDPGRESIVFGAIVAVAVVSAFLSARGASRLVSGAIGQLAHVPEGEARMYAAFGYITVAGILLPLWGLRVLDWAGIAFFDGQSAKGLFLGLAAIPYTTLGRWLSRRANSPVAFPLLATGAGLSFLSITMAFPDHGLSVTTLSMAAAHAFLVAYLFRGTILGYVALWAAAALLPLAGARAIQGLDVKDEVYGLFLAGTALLYLGGASLWERRHSKAEWRKEVFVRFLSSMLGEARTGELTSVAVPFHGTAFLLTIAAAVLAWPSPGEPAGIVAIAAFGAVALFYAAASWRWGTSLLLYPGLASASVAYGLSVSYVAPASTGLALLPGSALSLGLGWLAYHWKAGANVSRPTSLWSELTQGRSAVAWAAPLLAAGYAGTIGAVLLSLPDEGPRLATLAFASVASGLSWLQFRGRVWLVALLASAHGTYASAITLDVLGLAPHEMGVLFVPAAAVMGLLVGRNLAKDGTKGSPSALLSPGSLPLTLAGAVDVGLSLVLAAQSDWTGLLVTAAYAGLAAVTAHFTDLPLLAHASSFFAISATTFASRLLGMAWSQSAVVWSAQGLIMWWGSQGARAVTTSSAAQETRGVVRLSIWAAPLRDAGMLLSWAAAVLVASVAAWSLAGAPAFDAGRHILGAPLAEGDSLQSATAALGFLGLLYLGIAFVERRPVFVYLSLGLLLASWTLQMLVFRVSHYQAYAIPAGLYLLTVAFFERRRASSSLATAIEGSGVALLLGSSFWQSAVQDASLAYGLLLAVESILLVLWASANKTRLPFVAGIAAFVVEVFWQTGEWLLGFGPAVIALVAGILIVTSVALVEWKRQQLVALGRQWSSRMTAWRW
ncbi:MAG: hypothetical protein HY681_03135, partial [Chloroflexi bacterium]|nr:hypothetical protein [Chloroflexota bacterium]